MADPTITPEEARAMRDAAPEDWQIYTEVLFSAEEDCDDKADAVGRLAFAAPALASLYADTADELAQVKAERDALRAELARARDYALEEAAQEIDCGCPDRDALLAARHRPNSADRWRACGDSSCAALAAAAIRARKGKRHE